MKETKYSNENPKHQQEMAHPKTNKQERASNNSSPDGRIISEFVTQSNVGDPL